MTPDLNLDYSARDMLNSDEFRKAMQELSVEVHLGEIWRAMMSGHSVTAEEAKLLIVDLLLTTEYFNTAPPDATGDMLQRREGKREVMARILFLSDLPGSVITRLRRDVLDELQRSER